MAFHVMANVVFHQFRHQAIDGSPGGGEPSQNFCARFVFIQCALHRFHLANQFLGAIDQIEFFP
jgi:hypothetical protein